MTEKQEENEKHENRMRMHGCDVPFADWLRRQHEKLPSISLECGLSATDIDLVMHRYKSKVREGVGTRRFQSLITIEVKTRGGYPPMSQLDTLAKCNVFRGIDYLENIHLTHYGVFVLVMSGVDPDTSDSMMWGSFPPGKIVTDSSQLLWQKITLDQLYQLLRFELNPKTLELIEMGKKSFPNSGSLFKNENRTTDKHPEYSGSAEIDGVQYWISAWVKDGQKGKFFSLSFKPKDQQQSRGGNAGSSNQKRNSREGDEYDDDRDGVPF